MSLSVDIQKNYGDFQLSLAFQTEEKRIGVLGASGCGKSQTLKAIAGIMTPDRGKILLNDRTLFDAEEKINVSCQQRRVGYLFQNYALFPNMNVEKNIGVGIRSLPKEERHRRIAELLDRFSLTGLEKRLPHQLSGGQQQRVALARIMAYRPDVILLDEPFSALDAYLRDRLQLEMEEMLRDYEGTVVLVSHNRDEIYRFAGFGLLMGQGIVESAGPVKNIFRKPETRNGAILTGCKNISAARRIDDTHFAATDWGVQVHTKQILPPDFSYVGYRAHEFIPIYGERQENCIRLQLDSIAELPFEKNIYLLPENREVFQREDILTWLVQREYWSVLEEKGMPDYLQFREEEFLFLR